MYERLLDKNKMPAMEEYMAHLGSAGELFEYVNTYLLSELNSEKKCRFSAHDRCWGMAYHIKKKFVCDMYFEKDSFTIVTRLNEDNISMLYENISAYARECINNSPYRHRGWIEYRVQLKDHLEDVKTILQVRANSK